MASPSRTMEKFGTQTSKGKVITCWRNGDKYCEGIKIVIHPTKFKTYDQLKVEMNQKVGLYTGNVNKCYTMDKKMVKDIGDFEDGHNYICCGAEKLNEEVISKGLTGIFGKQEQVAHSSSVNTADVTSPIVTSAPSTPVKTSTTTTSTSTSDHVSATPPMSITSPPSAGAKKPVCSVYQSGTKPDKFSVQTEKAKVITAYRNGDKTHSGERITIHQTKFKTYDQLKEHLSKQVKLVTGAVRKVYSIDGKPVKDLNDFVDGYSYICCGGEELNKKDIHSSIVDLLKQQSQQQPAQ